MSNKFISIFVLFSIFVAFASTKQVECENTHQSLAQILIEAKEQFLNGDTGLSFGTMMYFKLLVEASAKDCGIPYDTQIKPSTPKNQGFSNCGNDLAFIISEITKRKFSTSPLEPIDHLEIRTLIKSFNPHVISLFNQCTSAQFINTESQNLKDEQMNCVICSVLVQLQENYIKLKKVNASVFVSQHFCTLFPEPYKLTCTVFIDLAGPFIIEGFTKQYNADQICQEIGYCAQDSQCHIEPLSQIFQQDWSSSNSFLPLDSKTSVIPPLASWSWLDQLIHQFGDEHYPIVDIDDDGYSTIASFRGWNWRGRDCDDVNANVYPGRQEWSGSKLIDYNCNGIKGFDLKGRSLKQKFCSNSQQIGVAVFGDSAGAHFSLPEQYLNVSMWTSSSFDDLLWVASNELDLPYKSAYTGFQKDKAKNPVRSVYKYLVDRNRCNRNDYQNIAVNGGDSGNSRGNIKALKRNATTDHPLLVFMELVGNDVCNSQDGTGWTPPDQFKQNVLELLNNLENKLPKGSHVFIIGIVDGRVLYDNLYDKIHPAGVTYEIVYDFLVCTKVTPCYGWLNSNQTTRNAASAHAAKLNNIYKQIINEYQFLNFDIAYYDFPAQQIMERRIKEGGNLYDLIEHSDGFHPGQRFNAYLADWIIETLQQNHPNWIGPVNPYNAIMDQLFQFRSKY